MKSFFAGSEWWRINKLQYLFVAVFATNPILPFKSTILSITQIATPPDSAVLFVKQLLPFMSALLEPMYLSSPP